MNETYLFPLTVKGIQTTSLNVHVYIVEINTWQMKLSPKIQAKWTMTKDQLPVLGELSNMEKEKSWSCAATQWRPQTAFMCWMDGLVLGTGMHAQRLALLLGDLVVIPTMGKHRSDTFFFKRLHALCDFRRSSFVSLGCFKKRGGMSPCLGSTALDPLGSQMRGGPDVIPLTLCKLGLHKII